MILTIDIGNTDITVVLYSKEGQHLHEFRVATKVRRTTDELGLALCGFLVHNKITNKDIKGAIISSVVPTVNSSIEAACERYLDIKPIFLNSALKIPLKIKIDSPSALGSDIIATSIGAIARYGQELIIFNFGTATVCNVIGSDNDYLGCMIATGINSSINALQHEAALLPAFRFQKPLKIPATSTNEALYAGIFYNTLGMIEKMIEEVRKSLSQYKFKVIATGGLSSMIRGHTKAIDSYDPDLTTFGLYKIYTEKHDI